MSARTRDLFTAIRTEGALLPPDLLARVAARDGDLPGLEPTTYGLAPSERLQERITASWNRLLPLWQTFREAKQLTLSDDPATGTTRQRLLGPLLEELGFGHLAPAHTLVIDGRDFPVSHAWRGSVPVHLVGFNVDLDTRTAGVVGAARRSPHGLVQELLNASDAHLWGLVSNGLRMRLLRDSAALTRQAYVEFDLEAILEGELYADFALLWLVCHATRFEGKSPSSCLLEKWTRAAQEQGTRALDALRDGVQAAIETLGRGYLAHPANTTLLRHLRDGEITGHAYYQQLLRSVYRLIVLLVAEDRGLLLDPDAPDEARERYARWYSLTRMRRIARERRGTTHTDLHRALRVVTDGLSAAEGCPPLGLAPLGGLLFSDQATPDLEGCQLANRDLLEAIRHLATTIDTRTRTLRSVDYRNLGAEELGSVYESLLELHPELDTDAATFTLTTASGSERKTTGSYYTPTSLIDSLLDTALDPILDRAATSANPEAALIGLRVLDPACGSGHFLVAAAHRIARRLAAARTGEPEPPPDSLRAALRDVTSHCVHGVDLNPMAVELCKVALWMEAITPGRPLSFLDHHILHGNALLGTTPDLMAAGIPDTAYKALEGDSKTLVSTLRKRNSVERKGQLTLDSTQVGTLAVAAHDLDEAPDVTLADLARKAGDLTTLHASDAFRHASDAADAWCVSFLGEKRPGIPAITTDTVRRLASGRPVDSDVREYVNTVARRYALLHWHTAFPAAYAAGGFDCVIGNPPWDKVELVEREYFAVQRPDIATASSGAKRKAMIERLATDDPALYNAFLAARRSIDAERFLITASGRFPLCGQGRINTYAIFAETMRDRLSPLGRAGVIVPTGIATDATTQHFFADLIQRGSLASLYSFENEELVFPAVHHAFRFCLLTVVGLDSHVMNADFVFFARQVTALIDAWRHFTLTADEIALLNPNTRTCPTFRGKRDAEITKRIFQRIPVLLREGADDGNPWGLTFRQGLFNMTTDSDLFYDEPGAKRLPLYEAKMVHQFDSRSGTYEGQTQAQANQGVVPPVSNAEHRDPGYEPRPRYWVDGQEVADRLSGKWDREWLLGWRDITSSVTFRTVIAAVIPAVGAGNKLPLAFPADPSRAAVLVATLNSFALDYVARQKVAGTTLNFFLLYQLPVLPPSLAAAITPWTSTSVLEWIAPRVVELVYTSEALRGFAADHNLDGAPFRWNEGRRFEIRAELDAACFQLYGVERDDLIHIMDSFWIVRDRDVEQFSSYRTKDAILSRYDALADAVATGASYVTPLDPPPGDDRARVAP